jgi:RimJ/RimL family protein N-acetyltransferase
MLTEGNVVVRPMRPDDADLLVRWQTDPEVMTGWALPQPILPHNAFTQDLAVRFTQFDVEGNFIIEGDGLPVGRIGFSNFDERHRSAELLTYIGEPGEQGKGYAASAIKSLVRYLFHQRRLHRLELTALSWNVRARRLYEGLGFQLEGTRRDYDFFNGRWHDEIEMAILATDPLPWLTDPVGLRQGDQSDAKSDPE